MNKPLNLLVITTGRQDWGVLGPLCKAFQEDDFISLRIIAGGMACSQKFGRIVEKYRLTGFNIEEELHWDMEDSAAEQASDCLRLVSDVLNRNRPDALLLVGDRFETLAAAMAATLAKIPIIHMYGGEETEGAFDNSIRHAVTKLSHLHFVSHKNYAHRLCLMGEQPQNVHTVGYINVENMLKLTPIPKSDLENELNIHLKYPVGLVTLHPTTLGESSNVGNKELKSLCNVLIRFPATWVITFPNVDPGNEKIRKDFSQIAAQHDNIVAVSTLGMLKYFSLMKIADFMLGNSSSGIIEAPSLRLPSINIGDRQKGRIRSDSVIDVPSDEILILDAINLALSAEFKARVKNMEAPFESQNSTQKVLRILHNWHPPSPPRKVFFSSPDY